MGQLQFGIVSEWGKTGPCSVSEAPAPKQGAGRPKDRSHPGRSSFQPSSACHRLGSLNKDWAEKGADRMTWGESGWDTDSPPRMQMPSCAAELQPLCFVPPEMRTVGSLGAEDGLVAGLCHNRAQQRPAQQKAKAGSEREDSRQHCAVRRRAGPSAEGLAAVPLLGPTGLPFLLRLDPSHWTGSCSEPSRPSRLSDTVLASFAAPSLAAGGRPHRTLRALQACLAKRAVGGQKDLGGCEQRHC